MSTVLDAVATATASVPRFDPLNTPPEKDADDQIVYPYGVFSGSLGRGDAYTLDVSHGMRHGRIVLQAFGRTAASAEAHMNQAVDRLLDRVLVLVGFEATPCLMALDPTETRDPDDRGVVGLTAVLTFTATKET